MDILNKDSCTKKELIAAINEFINSEKDFLPIINSNAVTHTQNFKKFLALKKYRELNLNFLVLKPTLTSKVKAVFESRDIAVVCGDDNIRRIIVQRSYDSVSEMSEKLGICTLYEIYRLFVLDVKSYRRLLRIRKNFILKFSNIDKNNLFLDTENELLIKIIDFKYHNDRNDFEITYQTTRKGLKSPYTTTRFISLQEGEHWLNNYVQVSNLKDITNALIEKTVKKATSEIDRIRNLKESNENIDIYELFK